MKQKRDKTLNRDRKNQLMKKFHRKRKSIQKKSKIPLKVKNSLKKKVEKNSQKLIKHETTSTINFKFHTSFFDELQLPEHISNSDLLTAKFSKESEFVYILNKNFLKKFSTKNFSKFEEEIPIPYSSMTDLFVDQNDNLWLLQTQRLFCLNKKNLKEKICDFKSKFFTPFFKKKRNMITEFRNFLLVYCTENQLFVISLDEYEIKKNIQNISIVESLNKKIISCDDKFAILSFDIQKISIEVFENFLTENVVRKYKTLEFSEFGLINDGIFLNNLGNFLILISEFMIIACDYETLQPASKCKRLVKSKRDQNGDLIIKENKFRFLENLPRNHILQFGENHYQIFKFFEDKKKFRSVCKDSNLALFSPCGNGSMVPSGDGKYLLITNDELLTSVREFGEEAVEVIRKAL